MALVREEGTRCGTSGHHCIMPVVFPQKLLLQQLGTMVVPGAKISPSPQAPLGELLHGAHHLPFITSRCFPTAPSQAPEGQMPCGKPSWPWWPHSTPIPGGWIQEKVSTLAR